MNQDPLSKLSTELEAFTQFDSTSPTQPITDTYKRILAIVQAIMLNGDNPDGHDRAWSLLKDDAFKDLTQVEEGHSDALADLKLKIAQVGHLLISP